MGTYGSATGLVLRKTSSGGQLLGLRAGNVMCMIDSDGDFKAGDGSVVVTSDGITATAGEIAGWTIGSAAITGTHARLDASGYISFGGSSAPPTAYGNTDGIWIGYGGDTAGKLMIYDSSTNFLSWDGAHLTWSAANTSLDSSGNLTATNATLSGQITATTGKIGGWDISSAKIYSTYAELASAGYVSFGSPTPPTAYGSAGVWLGYSSGAKLSLVNDASNYLKWDGAKLEIKTSYTTVDSTGKLTNTGGWIGGWEITSTQIRTGTGASDVVLDSSGKSLRLGTSLISGDGSGINLEPLSTGTVTISGTPSGLGHLFVNGNVTISTNGQLIHKGTRIGFFDHATASQQAGITDAKVTYTTGELDSEVEVITAFNTTNGKLNAILAVLEAYGLTTAA